MQLTRVNYHRMSLYVQINVTPISSTGHGVPPLLESVVDVLRLGPEGPGLDGGDHGL